MSDSKDLDKNNSTNVSRKVNQINMSINRPINNITKSTDDITKYLELYNQHFDKSNSFYKKYNYSVYENLLNLNDKFDLLSELFNSNSFLLSKKILIPYLKKINFVSFDSSKDIQRLEKILKDTNIPGFLDPNENLIKDSGIALNIEKYIKDCKVFFDDCHNFPESVEEPIFDPCKFPNILVLYNHFYEYCYDQKNLHNSSGNYYSKLNKLFLLPSLTLACLGAICSFLSSTCFFSDLTHNILSIIVGIMTSMVALLQALSSAYQFDIKSNSHFKSADLYDQVLTTIDFEKNYPANKSFFKDLEKEIIKIKSNNPYLIPTNIKNSYSKKKESKGFERFIKNSIVLPGQQELLESIHSGNRKLNINDNMDFIKSKINDLQTIRNDLVNHKYRSVPQNSLEIV